jgi:hypothetical protein
VKARAARRRTLAGSPTDFGKLETEKWAKVIGRPTSSE